MSVQTPAAQTLPVPQGVSSASVVQAVVDAVGTQA
jgi:hypothetical protein